MSGEFESVNSQVNSPAEVPACHRCQDVGWLYSGAGAAPCVCTLEARRAAAVRGAEATIGARFRSCSRSTWRGDWPLDAEVGAWPATPGQDPWALILLGLPGVGKTHVATAVFRELIGRSSRSSARWISMDELVAIAHAEISGDRPRSIERELAESDLLLFDDVGRTRATPHSLELARAALYLRHLHQLPTIVTANATRIEDFDAFDPSLTSRLREGTLVFALEGIDQRGRVA